VPEAMVVKNHWALRGKGDQAKNAPLFVGLGNGQRVTGASLLAHHLLSNYGDNARISQTTGHSKVAPAMHRASPRTALPSVPFEGDARVVVVFTSPRQLRYNLQIRLRFAGDATQLVVARARHCTRWRAGRGRCEERRASQ